MSTLGKRKEREEGQEKSHGSTLFVSNLPYTATSIDIQTLFSDIAPVRTAFVVLEHGTGVSKGVGYVSFAIREDATMAIDKISKEGITLDGRILRVQWAGTKNKDHEHAEETAPKPAKGPTPRPSKPAGPADPLAIRTVVISGLPAGIDSKTLWKKVRKLVGAEKVEWPVKTNSGEDSSLAHAIFGTPANASEAVNKLHAHVFKGALLSATLKKRLDGLAKTAAAKKVKPSAKAPSQQKSGGPAPNRASRLIVRNLPFDITEQDLRAIFLPYGPIYSVHIPVATDSKHEDDAKIEEAEEKPKPRSKGFAFVWFLSRKDAENAMEGCNGMTVEAGMAETLVTDKQKKKKQRREEKKRKAQEGEGGDAEQEEVDEQEEATSRKRTIAVDWALSKDKWEAEKAKIEAQEDQDVDMKSEDEGSSDEDDEDSRSEDESGSEDEQLGVHEDASDSGEESESHAEDDLSEEEGGQRDDEEAVKPTLPAPEVGTTVFVRNVPFEATDDELRTLFRAFGPLRYARVTMDAATGRSRGTGFTCFWNKEDADKAIEQSNILRAESGAIETPGSKKNPFKMPSLLTPDPSASIAQNLVLHGRTLDVSRAVTRDEASKLKEAGERQREKADKRNLYLLREGIILPNTPAAESLPPAEVEKRTQSFNARRALLRSNPSLFVSRTRLSIRQLPLFVSERMLKRLAIHAIRAFESEAKAGKREPLSSDELAVPTSVDDDAHAESDDDVKMEDDPSAKKRKRKDAKGKGRDTGVKQAKIVRQQDRVDPVTGKGRSRGYGFLELGTHADALRVLRWANNNFTVGRLFEEWWKAELEDLIAAEKRKDEGKRDEARIKRIREEIEKGVPPKSRGTLIVEFSIENIQVVQRRAAKTGAGKDSKNGKETKGRKEAEGKKNTTSDREKKVQRRESLPNLKTEEQDEGRPKKKRRTSDPPKPAAKSNKPKQQNEETSPSKGSSKIGSLIGRKRKERKMKKARG